MKAKVRRVTMTVVFYKMYGRLRIFKPIKTDMNRYGPGVEPSTSLFLSM